MIGNMVVISTINATANIPTAAYACRKKAVPSIGGEHPKAEGMDAVSPRKRNVHQRGGGPREKVPPAVYQAEGELVNDTAAEKVRQERNSIRLDQQEGT